MGPWKILLSATKKHSHQLNCIVELGVRAMDELHPTAVVVWILHVCVPLGRVFIISHA